MLHVISNRKVLPKGTEVLIFRYIKYKGVVSNDEYYLRGTVIDCSSLKEDELTPTTLTVLGEDGCEYWGSYGAPIIGDSFFRTKEDQIEYLKGRIAINNDTIKDLQDLNDRYTESIEELKQMKPKKKLRILNK